MLYVIVPVYNVEKYLEKCLDSIFNQTYKDFFVICVNDGSTDRSGEILSKYQQAHKNMIIINEVNSGLASARNTGLNYISNFDSLVTFIDSDDCISEDFFEQLVSSITKYDADIVCCSYFDLHEDGSIEKPYIEFDSVHIYSKHESIIGLFSGNIQSHSYCKVYKTSIWKKLRFVEGNRFMEDQSITFQSFLISNKTISIPYAGYYYLHRVGSLCQSKMTNNKVLDALEAYKFNCLFDYSPYFNNEQTGQVTNLAKDQLASLYLMLYPRFHHMKATTLEKERFKTIKRYVRENKIVKSFSPNIKKEEYKRTLYIISPLTYKIVYRLFFKGYEK